MATLVVHPDTGTGGTTVNGWVARQAVNETFSTIRAGAGNFTLVGSNTVEALLEGSGTSNQFDALFRGIVTWDTSPLTSAATITSATVSFACLTNYKNLGGGVDIFIAGATPAAMNNLQNSDYGQCQTTSFGSQTSANIIDDDNSYNDIPMNATGIAYINKTGITALSFQIDWDINNNFGGVWAANQISGYEFETELDLPAFPPKLTINYTLPTGGFNIALV